jgi:pimeloyl-ACP methyl ester carboxylesterase
MADVPTRYADSDGTSIAYQVHGEGPLDLVLVPGFVSHVELIWEDPEIARFLRRLTSFARLIIFDKRGQGLSDRTGRPPTLEESMDDLRAAMDAAGSGGRPCSESPRAGRCRRSSPPATRTASPPWSSTAPGRGC